jgi:hypothetical protein
VNEKYRWLAALPAELVSKPDKLLARVLFIPRLLTSPLRTLPDFLLMGFPKCGTTSLYMYLTQHPQIAAAFEKETRYFNYHQTWGLLWYRANFPTVFEKALRARGGKRVLTGEGTPLYILDPDTYRGIHSMNPEAKIIILLRNPIDRAYSNYRHLCRLGMAGRLDIGAYLDRELAGPPSKESPFLNIAASGVYVDYIRKLHAVFPRKQVLILKSEDLFAEPEATVGRCLRFLALPPNPLGKYGKFNDGRHKEGLDRAARKRLADFYRPHNRELYDYLGVDFGWDD